MKAQNLKAGHGKSVHATWTRVDGDVEALCGAGNRSSGQVNWRNSQLSYTTEAVTCKRCLAMLAQREQEATH